MEQNADRDIRPANPVRAPEAYPDVCVACATPPGTSGLAVIRMSGEQSPEIASILFHTPGGSPVSVRDMARNTCRFGKLVDPVDSSLIDEVVLTRFASPHSYTGEELIEISCHGGNAVKRAIIQALCASGARPAEPGEFTRRAFLNGKIDLTQAEAVMDLISAGASRSASAAAKQLEGGLRRLIRSRMDELLALMARIELVLEFPEHEDTHSAGLDLAADIRYTAGELTRLGSTFQQGRVLREGMTVVIAGRPNVGKSSLLNSLAGYDRAIVTEIPGTTRDTVEELIDIEGVPVRLIDTAGLRETADLVERIGIDRAQSAIREADLVFYLISPPWDPDTAETEVTAIRQIASEKPVTLILGKSDLPERRHVSAAIEAALPELPRQAVSTLTGEGREEIRRTIRDAYDALGVPGHEEILITNARHWHQIMIATERLQDAACALESGIPLDVASTLLRAAADALAEITGDSVGETLIDTIFSRFCVGK